jgi:hypothetical protein
VITVVAKPVSQKIGMTALVNQSKNSPETAAENGIHDARAKTPWKANPASFVESNSSSRLFKPGFQVTAAGWRLHAAGIPVGYSQDRPQFDWP